MQYHCYPISLIVGIIFVEAIGRPIFDQELKTKTLKEEQPTGQLIFSTFMTISCSYEIHRSYKVLIFSCKLSITFHGNSKKAVFNIDYSQNFGVLRLCDFSIS